MESRKWVLAGPAARGAVAWAAVVLLAVVLELGPIALAAVASTMLIVAVMV